METKFNIVNESTSHCFKEPTKKAKYRKHTIKDYIIWCCCCNKKIKHSKKLRYMK